MKKFILATVAFSFIATPAAFAQSYHPGAHKVQKVEKYKVKKVEKYKVVKKHRWAKGQRLDRNTKRVVIRDNDYGRYHLRRPPHGYHWVRVDNDFMMVATATGLISSILYAAAH
jgi:Ni/Co efflux regulator RcnB